MSQHSQRTQQGPGIDQVVAGAVSIALSAAASVYVVSGPGMDPRKAVAVVLGGVLTGVLTVRVMGLVAQRAVIADRAERAAERERYIQEYERDLAARERDLAVRQRERPEPRYEDRQEPRYEDRQVDEQMDAYGYQADPERPWNAFEPVAPGRAALGQVGVPLPPRDGYVDPGPYSSYVPVSPGRVDPDATELRHEDRPTEIMARVDPDASELRHEDRPTEIIAQPHQSRQWSRQHEDRPTEVIERVQ